MPLGFAKSILAKVLAAVGRDTFTILVNGNMEKDTAIKKFGTASADTTQSTGGSGDALEIADEADFLFGSTGTDMTFECWVYFNTFTPSGTNNTGEGSHPIFNWCRGTSGFIKACFGVNESGYLGMDYSAGSGYGGTTYQDTGTTLNTGQWYHIAFVWEESGNNIYVYRDGTRVINQTGVAEPNWTRNTSGFGLFIGANYWQPDVHMDEIRVSTTARYTGASFSAPTSAFTNDEDTILLIHADGTDTATDFEDDGG